MTGPAAAPDSHLEVAICGAFDMQNFGDLLFPALASRRLEPHGVSVVSYAPSGSNPGLGVTAPRPIRELFAPEARPDAMLIGGGYIVHSYPLSRFVKLDPDGPDQGCGSELVDCWAGATVAAALHRIPLLWNAPGVPFPFSTRQAPMLRAIAAAADYLSLRDSASAAFFLPDTSGTPVAVSVVPDPVAEISRLWPQSSLSADFRNVVNRHGLDTERPILAIHVRDRSLQGVGPDGLAALIDRFCTARNLFPVMIAVGDAHHDAATARSVSRCMTGAHLVLDKPRSLQEIAAVLAHARLYVGASLHGYIVATSFGVPGALVARPSYSKFDGFVQHAGWPQDRCPDWPAAFGRVEELRAGPLRRPLPDHVFDAVRAHWQCIAGALNGKAPLAAERSGFLGRYFDLSVARAGTGWVTRHLNSNLGGMNFR